MVRKNLEQTPVADMGLCPVVSGKADLGVQEVPEQILKNLREFDGLAIAKQPVYL